MLILLLLTPTVIVYKPKMPKVTSHDLHFGIANPQTHSLCSSSCTSAPGSDGFHFFLVHPLKYLTITLAILFPQINGSHLSDFVVKVPLTIFYFFYCNTWG